MAEALGRGARITGEERAAVRSHVVERYGSGEAIRAIADDLGRSYGWVQGLLKEAGVELRGRGGATRGEAAARRRQPVAPAAPATRPARAPHGVAKTVEPAVVEGVAHTPAPITPRVPKAAKVVEPKAAKVVEPKAAKPSKVKKAKLLPREVVDEPVKPTKGEVAKVNKDKGKVKDGKAKKSKPEKVKVKKVKAEKTRPKKTGKVRAEKTKKSKKK